jgi:GNAT superfamily N-acetyltransferase
MARDTGGSVPGPPAVARLGEEDWRLWRDVRLAALADSPAAFASTGEEERAIPEPGWRAMLRDAAIFVARSGGAPPAGVVAGLYRESPRERGLGAMWVAPPWRGRGVAASLVAAVVGWSTGEGAAQIGLWVPEDHARALHFYQRQGFRATGLRRPFPGAPGRFICQMSLTLLG